MKRVPVPPLMPKQIRLAGRVFRLEEVGESAGFRGNTMGQYVPMEGKILVMAQMSDDQKKASVMHELFHDLDNQTDCSLSEHQVNSMAAFMFAALRDNPDLVAWLMS